MSVPKARALCAHAVILQWTCHPCLCVPWQAWALEAREQAGTWQGSWAAMPQILPGSCARAGELASQQFL